MPNQVFRKIQATATNTKDVSKLAGSVARDLNLIQSNISSALQSLQQTPFFGGNVFTNITINASVGTHIAHGLGRIPRYWLVMDVLGVESGAYFGIFRISWTDTDIFLAGADVIITLWVN